MTTRTQVVWTATDREIVRPQIAAEIVILTSQGKTTGDLEITDGPETGQITFIRAWTTLQDAEDWLSWLTTLGPVPVSTAILPETLPE
jgi:hypothetical protein